LPSIFAEGGSPVETKFGCQRLTDDELLSEFEDCRLNPASFHHRDHVRLAWICVQRYGPLGAEEHLLQGIRKITVHLRIPEKFMYTTTAAWARLVAGRCAPMSPNEKFEDWIARWPELLDKNLLSQYYAGGTLETPQARSAWIEPDRKPLNGTNEKHPAFLNHRGVR
jgi:hypothetical protein